MPGRRVGVDVGGTKICGVVVDREGKIMCGPVVRPTGRQRPPEEIVETIVATVRSLMDAAASDGIGLGLPTTLDAGGGMVPCPNLPTMGGVRIRQELESRLGSAVVLANDANCFAYGEWGAGAGKGVDICCGVTLGTGFGMGVVVDGRIYRGSHRNAGEIWCAPFRDGRKVEEIVSGPGVAASYQERTGVAADASEVARRARAGDEVAAAVWQEFGEALGFALSYAVNVLDPGVVVIGGSMAAARDVFGGAMQAVLERHVYDYQSVKLVPAALGGFAGAVGAALLPADSM